MQFRPFRRHGRATSNPAGATALEAGGLVTFVHTPGTHATPPPGCLTSRPAYLRQGGRVQASTPQSGGRIQATYAAPDKTICAPASGKTYASHRHSKSAGWRLSRGAVNVAGVCWSNRGFAILETAAPPRKPA